MFLHSSIIKSITVVTLLALFNAAPASAQILTETFNNVSVLKSSMKSEDFTVPDFNTSLGTLEDIDLTFKITDRALIRILNMSRKSLSFTNASVTSPITVTGPNDVKYSATLTAVVDSGVAQSGINWFKPSKDVITGTVQVSPSDFALWENQSNNVVGFDISRLTNTIGGMGSYPLFFGGGSRQKAATTVQYTYLAVPEPSEKYLVGIVAVLMASLPFISRRRKALALRRVWPANKRAFC